MSTQDYRVLPPDLWAMFVSLPAWQTPNMLRIVSNEIVQGLHRHVHLHPEICDGVNAQAGAAQVLAGLVRDELRDRGRRVEDEPLPTDPEVVLNLLWSEEPETLPVEVSRYPASTLAELQKLLLEWDFDVDSGWTDPQSALIHDIVSDLLQGSAASRA